MMCGTCTISDQWGGGGSSLTWWPTTFVTCQLLVSSPTYFEIIYDLVGSTKLVACHLWALSPTCFEILYDLMRKQNPSPCSPSKRKKNYNIHESVLVCFLFFFLVQSLPLPLVEAKYGDQQFWKPKITCGQWVGWTMHSKCLDFFFF